jgi:hypothetical protein
MRELGLDYLETFALNKSGIEKVMVGQMEWHALTLQQMNLARADG